jgi:LemA protein
MRPRRAYEGGVDGMLIWIIVVVIPIGLFASALLASKGGASRRDPTSDVWSETEVDYKARHDLVPQLEGALRGYAFGPREARQAVTRAGASALSTTATGGTNVVEPS